LHPFANFFVFSFMTFYRGTLSPPNKELVRASFSEIPPPPFFPPFLICGAPIDVVRYVLLLCSFFFPPPHPPSSDYFSFFSPAFIAPFAKNPGPFPPQPPMQPSSASPIFLFTTQTQPKYNAVSSRKSFFPPFFPFRHVNATPPLCVAWFFCYEFSPLWGHHQHSFPVQYMGRVAHPSAPHSPRFLYYSPLFWKKFFVGGLLGTLLTWCRRLLFRPFGPPCIPLRVKRRPPPRQLGNAVFRENLQLFSEKLTTFVRLVFPTSSCRLPLGSSPPPIRLRIVS